LRLRINRIGLSKPFGIPERFRPPAFVSVEGAECKKDVPIVGMPIERSLQRPNRRRNLT
jgi:hypothetical protein